MLLPKEFKHRIKRQLGAEISAFLTAMDEPPVKGLRVNGLKLSAATLQKISPFALEPVPWAEDGFAYTEPDRPGKHPFHEAGLYYLQEPSAMLVASLAAVKPGERVLDLCAAPGGKSTGFAAALAGKGLLVSNEIHPARAKILSQNIERMGIVNAIVTNEPPERLAERFPGGFDCVVVDAPCSGEGMFRKDEGAIAAWSVENVAMCAARQREILRLAVEMVRPGGRLVYSTCTFAEEENEENAAWFAAEFGLFVDQMHRLWPHRQRGEGHFAALFHKPGDHACTELDGTGMGADETITDLWQSFAGETLQTPPEGLLLTFGDHLYSLPCPFPVEGLRVLRPGLHLGEGKKNRFEPSHALALALGAEKFQRCCPLTEEQAVRFLKGETLVCEGEKGWTAATVGDFPLGWGKWSDGMLKNHYPKGLRWV